MIGRADGNGIDAVGHFVEHVAPILEQLGFLVGIAGLAQEFVVDIADRHHFAVLGGIAQLFFTFAADADAGEANFIVGTFAFFRRRGARPKTGAGQSGRHQKSTATGLYAFRHLEISRAGKG
jgi:hypothetical protein